MEAWEENEEKKEYLRGYKYAKRRERRMLEQIQQLRLDAMFPCLQGDGMPRGSSQSDLSDYMESWEKLMDDLEKEHAEAGRICTEIKETIRKVKDEDEIEILERRYIMGQTWEMIAEKMGCDRRTAIRKHGKALKKIKIPENINYDNIKNLAHEALQKLKDIRPTSIGQAARISGVNPSDIAILSVYLKKMEK